jgi:hypothetical protein
MDSQVIPKNESNVIGTAMEEIGALLVEDVRLTLEVFFYGDQDGNFLGCVCRLLNRSILTVV